uniref:Derlin n=1 Tax=Tabanus bromius TaxID=304241 RepID=A0A0K8TQN2_TABBR
MTDIADWYRTVPQFTRYWLSATVGLSLIARFGLLPHYYLILWWDFVVYKLQLWRIVTAVFYYPLTPQTGFHFMLNCYFLYNYSLKLEKEQFQNKPSDYLFLLIFNWLNCVLIGLFFELTLLMDPMVLSVLYVWCMLNRDVVVNFWFGTQFKAVFLPWVLLGVNLILSGGAFYSLAGILVGHLYYVLKFKYPEDTGRPSYIETPNILKQYYPDISGGVYGFGAAPAFRRTNATNQQRPAGRSLFGDRWGRGDVLGGN